MGMFIPWANAGAHLSELSHVSPNLFTILSCFQIFFGGSSQSVQDILVRAAWLVIFFFFYCESEKHRKSSLFPNGSNEAVPHLSKKREIRQVSVAQR